MRLNPWGVCLYSHSEIAHGKSLWIHKKEQKNYPWHFSNQVVGFSLGLSDYKSSLTNRVEEKRKSGNCSTCSTCWAHFCCVVLNLQRLFSCCLLTGEKRPPPWVENGFDLTAVRCLGRLYLKRMLLALFADRNLSPLRLAHLFTRIPLSFIEPTL